MDNFIFDLQRFVEQTITAGGEPVTIDGVTYTAISDAVLNLDDENKVSGIASGKVTAVISGAETSPTVTFDATDSAIDFSATSDGEILIVTAPFPIEFSEGEFTYKGNTLEISAGSIIAVVSKREGYTMRNEIFYEYGSGGKYTFTDTAFSAEGGHTRVLYTFTNGDDVRTLEMEGYGQTITNYSGQGFTLVKGSSNAITIGGYTVTATAIEDAGINIYLSADGLILIPNQNDGALNVALSRGEQEIFAGDLECTSGTITLGYDHAVTFSEGTSFDFTWNGYTSTVTTTATATTDIALTDTGLSFTPHDGDGALGIVIRKDDSTIFGGTLNVTGGTIYFDASEQKFSFTKGTKIALSLGTDGSQEMDFEIVDKDASFKIEADTEGNFTITPNSDDGSIDVTLKRDDKTVFQNNVSVNGSMIINPVTNLLTLTNGTTVTATFENYTITATASGNASSTMSLTADGISITPQTDDNGKLNITLTGTSSGSLSADIEVLSGGFLFGLDGALSVTAGTEMQINFGDGYIVNFTADKTAGGAISIGTDGITFAPGSDDGGLQLSITRDGETRSASLDVMGGSVTYKLDGSISLTKGTVVRNVFDSGNILTITANTDASGSITFNPQTGLTIAPTTADALNVVLTKGNLDTVISSINGIINYRGGIVTASDGTTANMRVHNTWEIKFSTEGGTASIQFTDDRTIYTAGEGATFTVDYLNGITTAIQNGSYANVYDENIEDYVELISEGTILRSNDAEVVFTLEKAGNYTLNGMDFTTSSDGVEVQLSNYNTVTFAADAGITFDGNTFSGGGTVSIIDGKISIDNNSSDTLITGTAGDDSIINTGTSVTINALGGNDLIINNVDSSVTAEEYGNSISAGDGNDTILNDGISSTLDGGAGNNLIRLTEVTEGASGQVVVLNGKTTVEGFNTGFGEGADTVYITGEGPAVDFKDEGLSLYYDDDTDNYLTFSDIKTTARLNFYYAQWQLAEKNVFIADDEWYKVTDGEATSYVGATAKMNHGVDFSGISSALNISLDTDYAPENDFYVNNVYSIRGGAGNTTITGSDKDDTIIAGTGATTINAGAGNNLVNVEDAESALIYLAGNTTVEGFQTGFGEGTDTIYIDGDPAGVDLKASGLTFPNSTDSLTLSDITTTDKVNIYHERRSVLNKGVFIAKGDWYSVESSDLSVGSGEEVYFVGSSPTPNHGVDFSGISSNLNVTIDTAYEDSEDFVPGTTTWINNVYSIRGGAGNTTITGSKKDDTIIAGAGSTTINGGDGDDYISLNSGAALIQYATGDGNDSIVGFNENSTLNISGNGYHSSTSGNDLILSIGNDKITLSGAANLDSVNITGTYESKIPTSTEDIVEEMTGSYDYGETVTDQEEVATLLESKNLDGDMALLLENKSADFSKSEGSKSVTLAGGKNQNIKFNKEGNNVAVIDADAVGKKNISLGGGGDLAVVEDTGAKVNLTASTGNDTIVSNGENVFVKVNSKGKTDIFANGGKMTVEGYDASTETGFGTNYDDILTAIEDGGIVFSKGNLTIGAAVIDGVNNLANIFDADGNMQKVGDATQDEALDLSKEKADIIATANENSTITSGKGDDTIFAGAGSQVDAGVGKNLIKLDGTGDATIILSDGRNTIENFNATFDDGDKISIDEANSNIKFDGENLTVKNGAARALLENISSENGTVKILTVSNGKELKTAIAQKDATITAGDELADVYIGDKSGVDFNGYEEALTVDLSDAKVFSGINQITVGGGQNTLIVSSANETLSGNADGVTEFIFGAGGGRDVIQNFNFDVDKISVGAAVTSVNMNDAGGVRLQLGDDILTLEDAQGKIFKINEFAALVDENITYDAEANYFLATSKKASVIVDEGAEIWLDGSHGKTFVGDIRTLDASNSEDKNILAGNDLDNTIIGGSLENSLWGGNGGDDLLQGGTGKNMFFYALGNGDDTITGANDGDVVYLSNVMLEQIAGSNFTDGAVVIRFINGGQLTVNDDGKAVNFVVGEQTFRVNGERTDFITKTKS